MNQTLTTFIAQCCLGTAISPADVIDNLLSIQDEADIIAGDLKIQEVAWIIHAWAKSGSPRYTDKPKLAITPLSVKNRGRANLAGIKELLKK